MRFDTPTWLLGLLLAVGCNGPVRTDPEEAVCGDGLIDGTEACDDGNAETEACLYGEEACVVCDDTCAEASGETSVCGDGVVDEGSGEDCDDAVNDGTCGTCTNDCTWAEDCGLEQVSAGDLHTCGVKSDGTVACWGRNSYGESTPPSGRFESVSAGEYDTCGVKSDHSVTCWGEYVR